MKRGFGNIFRIIVVITIIASFFIIIGNIIVYTYFVGFSKTLHTRAGDTGSIYLSIEAGDTTPPNIRIVAPENTTYTSQRSGLDYTVSDSNLQSCWYSLDSGNTNISITCGSNVTGISSSEGSNTWRVYANDSSNNKNFSSVAFTISTSSPSPGPSGGGGGGSKKSLTRDFELEPEEINLVMVSGEHEEKMIKIKNTGEEQLTIDLEITGILDLVGIDTNQLILNPKEEKTVLLTITAPESGIFAGKIRFTSGSLRRDALVIINVKSSAASLFDVSLTIPESYKIISPGNNIKAFISLLQIGEPFGVDVTINYIIKDFDGNTLLKETESFFVLKSKSFVKEFIAENLQAGDYIAGIEVIYPEGFATSSAHFNIKTVSAKDYTLLIAIIILAILSIIVIIFEILRYKKAGKQIIKNRKNK